jgi:hypothetical protein
MSGAAETRKFAQSIQRHFLVEAGDSPGKKTELERLPRIEPC